jgi:PHD/YefM family antitoxin component YafN of YafNO toxin-antitoxin module
MVQRVVTSDTIENDWESVQESVVSSDDAVIVEANGKPNVVVITYDRYQRTLDLERDREYRYAEARRRFDALTATIGDRNSDLTPEEIEELGNRVVNERDDEYMIDEAANTESSRA